MMQASKGMLEDQNYASPEATWRWNRTVKQAEMLWRSCILDVIYLFILLFLPHRKNYK